MSVKYAVACNSGTDALHLALKCCGIGLGDEVITVANTCVPTIAGIRLSGAVPRFVDVDSKTFTMDINQIEGTITHKTKAILPVNLYGNSVDYDDLVIICRKHKLALIEDNAQGIGSTYKGRNLGTIGDIGCLSFYPSKNLGTFGDGGAIITNNEVFHEKVVKLRNYGQAKRYFHELEGINSRLDEIQAAMLSVLLDGLPYRNARRMLLARRILEGVKNVKIILPIVLPWFQSNFHLFVVRTKDRDGFQEFLGQRGIDTLIHYPIPVHLQQAYIWLSVPPGALPVTEALAKEIVSLPLYPELSDGEVDYMIGVLNEY